MGGDAIAGVLAERFRIDRPPTLLARRSSKARIGFSHMRCGHAMRGRSLYGTARGGFCISRSTVVAVFRGPVDGRAAQRRTRLAVSVMHSWSTCATIRVVSLDTSFRFTSLLHPANCA